MQILVLINEYELWTSLQAMYFVLDQISSLVPRDELVENKSPPIKQ